MRPQQMPDPSWLALLEPLRHHLKERDFRGKKGSLRWLETVMSEQGGRAGTVRNILYKNLGSASEKQRLFEIIKTLYQAAQLPEPSRPAELRSLDAKKLLGRDKRLILARFIRQLAQGARPQFVVVGRPATGKGVLLEQLRQACADHLFINLVHDVAPSLHNLADKLGIQDGYQALLAQLSPKQPYAIQADYQNRIRQIFVTALNARQQLLFIRAEESATLSGLALRLEQGQVSLSTWLEPWLLHLQIPYLLACSSPPESLSYFSLRPPSRQEARMYLQQRLPDSEATVIETLLNQAGNNYGELSRLALLELCRRGDTAQQQLHSDPQLAPLLLALSALSPESDPQIPIGLFEAVTGKRLAQLRQAEKALIEVCDDHHIRPAHRALLPAAKDSEGIHRRALEYYQQRPHNFRLLYHAQAAGAYETLLEQLQQNPAQLSLLPELWTEAQSWPLELREQLALLVVQYRSVLGNYSHPECQQALSLLSYSPNPQVSAFAKVKMAEAYIDEGDYAQASKLMQQLPPLDDAIQAEALLVQAALSRWQGDYEQAQMLVQEALALPMSQVLSDRAQLWQGLVNKDAGRFDTALTSLRAVKHLPLLIGRARYQEGDILLRTGQVDAGVRCLREALSYLHESPAEERARVRARLGTGLRQLGAYREASIHFRRALHIAPDAFTRARITSEASILEAARGHAAAALDLAADAEFYFRKTTERPEEARYRHRRTLYRLAVAYWSWQTGEAFRAPFRAAANSQHARDLLTDLLPQVQPLAAQADRYASLLLDCSILLALMLPAAEALICLEQVTPLDHPHLQQQHHLAKTAALLRLAEPQGAALELASLRQRPADPSLQAWKALLEAEMMLALGKAQLALDIIDEAVTLPAAFRYHLGRRWGQVLTQYQQEELAHYWLRDTSPLSLPEALARHFVGSSGWNDGTRPDTLEPAVR